MNNAKKVRFLKVTQNSNDFFVCSLSVETLLKVCHTRQDDFSKSDVLYQRKLDNKRLSQIHSYMADVKGILPTAVVLNSMMPIRIDGDFIEINTEKDRFFIIDGQHRIFGCSNIKPSIELVVVLMDCLDVDRQSELFLTINNEQKKVDSTVRFNMMVHDSVKTPEKVVRNIAFMFNSDNESPFFNMIRFSDDYGKKNDVKISLASFAEPIVNFIYRSQDHYLIKRYLEDYGCYKSLSNYKGPSYDGRIFWSFYRNDKEDTIYKILFNYFKVMKKIFRKSWGNPNYITNKTTGYNAMIMLFRNIFSICKDENNFSTSFLYNYLNSLQNIEDDFTVEKYSLGKIGSYELYKTMKRTLGISDEKSANNADYSLLDVIVDDDFDGYIDTNVSGDKKMVLSDELDKQNISEMEKIKILRGDNELFYSTIYSLKINRPELLSAILVDELHFVVGVGLVAVIA